MSEITIIIAKVIAVWVVSWIIGVLFVGYADRLVHATDMGYPKPKKPITKVLQEDIMLKRSFLLGPLFAITVIGLIMFYWSSGRRVIRQHRKNKTEVSGVYGYMEYHNGNKK